MNRSSSMGVMPVAGARLASIRTEDVGVAVAVEVAEAEAVQFEAGLIDFLPPAGAAPRDSPYLRLNVSRRDTPSRAAIKQTDAARGSRRTLAPRAGPVGAENSSEPLAWPFRLAP
jgi:hypothetical protein